MPTFTTYCDLSFLADYYRAKPSGDPLDYDASDRRWLEVHRFLTKETDVVLSASQDELAHLLQRYPFLRYYQDKTADTRFRLDPDANDQAVDRSVHAQADSPWRLYMMNNLDGDPEELSASYGTLFLTSDEVDEGWKQVGRQLMLNVGRDGEPRLTSWADLRRYASPLTGLIVVDRYMLKNLKIARENIFQMLVQLLPHEPNERPIHVMLVTEEIDDRYTAGQVYEELLTTIQEALPDLWLELSLVIARGRQTLRDYHDRHVFANYGFMKSGHSFNYFSGGTLKKDTTLDIHPTLDREVLSLAAEKLKRLKRIVANVPEKWGEDYNVIGDKGHPFFDTV